MDLDPVEIRVLGCLVEKQRTTPDAYPLTLNALRLACNQTTNRDPVVTYDEATVRDAAQSLGRRRLARLASGHTTRATKYRHLLDEAFALEDVELAVLTVLMLRGPQTPGELKARAERLHPFPGLAAVEQALDGLIKRGFAERLARRPGQKEERYAHQLGSAAAAEPAPPAATAPPAAAEPPTGTTAAPTVTDAPPAGPAPAVTGEPADDATTERLDRLETELRQVRADLQTLRRELGDLRRELGAE